MVLASQDTRGNRATVLCHVLTVDAFCELLKPLAHIARTQPKPLLQNRAPYPAVAVLDFVDLHFVTQQVVDSLTDLDSSIVWRAQWRAFTVAIHNVNRKRSDYDVQWSEPPPFPGT